MSQNISLREAERKVFRIAYNDCLWDIFLGCFFLIFAVAPYLSVYLGDFWSSVIFLPFWGVVYLAIRLVRKYVVAPRIGMVRFGVSRIHKLMRFSLVMLVVNVIALILGLVFAQNFGVLQGHLPTFALSVIFLIGFSLAAYFLDFNRLFFYGLLVGISPLVGEWLFTRGYATHHGFPIVFGASSGIMMVTGFSIFLRFLYENPIPRDEIPAETA